MECEVEYEYLAQEEDELTIKKGDVIRNVVKKTDGWWQGTLQGKTGMFPDNFVKVIKKPPPKAIVPAKLMKPICATTSKSQTTAAKSAIGTQNKSSRQHTVLFPYIPVNKDELKLEVGDIVEFINEIEDGWWRGKLKGRVGLFPSNFVSELEVQKLKPRVHADVTDSSRHSSNEVKGQELAECLYAYQAENEDELTLVQGDIIKVISKNLDNEDGWWKGQLNGKTGLFPDNFVKLISPASEGPTRGVDPLMKAGAISEKPKIPSSSDSTSQPLKVEHELDSEKLICSICMDKENNIAFGCGHVCCATCAEPLQECHMCRSKINTKIKLFF